LLSFPGSQLVGLCIVPYRPLLRPFSLLGK
jgi:hypothetical protein